MSVASTEPLVIPLLYDPSFKVDVRLHEPLLGSTTQTLDIDVELMSLCSQLDIICQKELSQHKLEKIEHGRVSSDFTNKASMVCDRMQQLMLRSSQPNTSLQQYIVMRKFDLLFPRAAAYLENPGHFNLNQRTEGLDNYYADLSSLQNLSALSRQINSDLCNLSDHKYIAHQMAILYQSLTNVGHALLDPYKQSIEENFKSIKSALSQEREPGVKQLYPEQKEWFLNLTSGIVNTINGFPSELTGEMSQPALVLKRTST
ncbi:uncharacterized protein LOC125657784 [Ostrea edulis]|uniref:uncharacterized protein LOC125657784 n=1 Tax=Ostrea edulis TaxID=37623 RepID=UPI002095156A|nr:uncharacterized protein LOC125657784 [Ostrea edulis]